MNYIYALIDPFTCKVRYIGKSNMVKERFQNHCNDNSVTHRTNWIKSLKRAGKKPILAILQELPENEDWQQAEKKWIAIAKKYGWDLTNCTDGGDGVLNLSGEGKERMLKTWKGRKHKPESLAKISAASKGRKHTNEHKEHMRAIMKNRVNTWADKVQKSVRKFTDEDIIKIQQRMSNGEKVVDLSKEFNVHRTTMSKIKLGTYKTFVQKSRAHLRKLPVQ